MDKKTEKKDSLDFQSFALAAKRLVPFLFFTFKVGKFYYVFQFQLNFVRSYGQFMVILREVRSFFAVLG